MKFLILVLTLTAILNFTACGEDGNVVDQNQNQKGDSVIDDAGDAIQDVGDGIMDGAQDMGEGVKDGLDEVTGNDKNGNNNNQNNNNQNK